jgi:hypothetical protein
VEVVVAHLHEAGKTSADEANKMVVVVVPVAVVPVHQLQGVVAISLEQAAVVVEQQPLRTETSGYISFSTCARRSCYQHASSYFRRSAAKRMLMRYQTSTTVPLRKRVLFI